MKYIQATGTPDLDKAPEFFQVLAGSSYVTEARLFDLNISPRGRPTVLFEVDGDVDPVRTELDGSNGLQTVETAPVTDGKFNLLGTLDLSTIPLLQDVFGALTQEGLVVAKPVIYRDGQVHVRIVGSSSTLQTAISKLSSNMEFEITTIGEFDRSRDTPLSMLSERQREVLVTAFNLGYYEHPRETTHGDIADRLRCAPNTISDHLQKAEKKIMTEALESEFAKS
jgi:hypothetical protein